jgi:uncharacterized protein (TIGR02118 family)
MSALSVAVIPECAVIKLMTTVYKRDDWTDEEFFAYWRERHAPLVVRLPGLRRYVMNLAQFHEDRPRVVHGFAELWFDSLEDAAAAIGSPEGQAARQDVAVFSDLERNQAVFVDELVVVGAMAPS